MNITIGVCDETLERFYELGEKSWTLMTDEDRKEWERIKQVVALKVYFEFATEKKIRRMNGDV